MAHEAEIGQLDGRFLEIGQLAALATMLLLLRAAPQLRGSTAKRWISAGIALAGLAWLIDRIL